MDTRLEEEFDHDIDHFQTTKESVSKFHTDADGNTVPAGPRMVKCHSNKSSYSMVLICFQWLKRGCEYLDRCGMKVGMLLGLHLLDFRHNALNR